MVINETMRKFGAPDTVIHSYRHWSVLLRKPQVTLGALVLAAHDPADRFSSLSRDSFTELQAAIQDIEQALTGAFHYEKINYLMLMMVDPDVHFHVIPRYRDRQLFGGMEFTDAGWPGPPDLKPVNTTEEDINRKLMEHIRQHWPARQ